MMTKTDVINILRSRYSCEVLDGPAGIDLYFKSLHCDITWFEKIQKFGFGCIYDNKKQIWSTGEFARADKYSLDEFIYGVLDHYFPIKDQLTLF